MTLVCLKAVNTSSVEIMREVQLPLNLILKTKLQ